MHEAANHPQTLLPRPAVMAALGSAIFITGVGCSSGQPDASPTQNNISISPGLVSSQVKSEEVVEVAFTVYTTEHKPIKNVGARLIINGDLNIENPTINPWLGADSRIPKHSEKHENINIYIPKNKYVEIIFSKSGFQEKSQFLYLNPDSKRESFVIYLQAEKTVSNHDLMKEEAKPSSPIQYIQSYYANINEDKLGQAWQMLKLELQQKHISYPLFYSRWSRVDQVQLQSLKTISQGDDWAIVEAKATYIVNDLPREVAPQHFTLAWDMTTETWQIADLEEIE